MEFLKRPVAPYFVPVPDLEHLPSQLPVEPVEQPPLAGGRAPATEASHQRPAGVSPPPSPRIVQVLALESPTVAELADFLADPDPRVRRTAVSTLVEDLPDRYDRALLGALRDDDAEVRRVAADGVRELVEVIPTPEDVATYLNSADPVVRSVAVYLLSARRVGKQGHYRRALADVDHRVRIEAVRALVSVDDADGVSKATGDDNREVRIAAANGLSTLGAGADAVRRLIGDGDPLVRAAALAALAAVGCRDDDLADVQRALTEPAWQVREGAAKALAGAAPTVAVPTLKPALTDQHLDVRKAAVLTLTRWAADEPAARDALGLALADGDADVRAYARQALAGQPG
jgi:HEAT repeat protein